MVLSHRAARLFVSSELRRMACRQGLFVRGLARVRLTELSQLVVILFHSGLCRICALVVAAVNLGQVWLELLDILLSLLLLHLDEFLMCAGSVRFHGVSRLVRIVTPESAIESHSPQIGPSRLPPPLEDARLRSELP